MTNLFYNEAFPNGVKHITLQPGETIECARCGQVVGFDVGRPLQVWAWMAVLDMPPDALLNRIELRCGECQGPLGWGYLEGNYTTGRLPDAI